MDNLKKWENRYKNLKEYNLSPSILLEQYIDKLNIKNSIDIAAGIGRNSLFLAKKGIKVKSVDFSKEALDILKNLAKKENTHISIERTNLKDYKIKPKFFDLVIIANYLDIKLYLQLTKIMKKGSFLFIETFISNHKYSIKKETLFEIFKKQKLIDIKANHKRDKIEALFQF